MNDPIINKVAESGLVTLDLEKYYPSGSNIVFDMKDYLFMGLILKEKEFREALKNTDWAHYKEKNVAVTCSRMPSYPCGLICWLRLTSSLLQQRLYWEMKKNCIKPCS